MYMRAGLKPLPRWHRTWLALGWCVGGACGSLSVLVSFFLLIVRRCIWQCGCVAVGGCEV